MKEEILEMLKDIKLDLDESSKYFEDYKQIKTKFKNRIQDLENSDNMDEYLYNKMKEYIEKINNAQTDFKKYQIVNNLQTFMCAMFF